MENQFLKEKKPVNSPLTEEVKKKEKVFNCRPTPAFISASWAALFIGMVSYCIGLWNVGMELNEKGYYFTILLFGLFSVVSVQKSVRDRQEGIPVTDVYYGICWFTTIASLILLIIGLWNADIELSEKGFYGMSFALALFGVIAVQKNIRDIKWLDDKEK
ncbi:inner membrane protein YiaA [Ulvibacter antarcticus]|uniref:Putative membrane protein YiaA n=1 Tax=Ulvibacter antarcticus TaxID=442714 RepID=A0A3L9YDS3_9FLAO|nr:inner membrane protein YiaA [Ulvibacter antarcticus]RMA57189.1 putative membrane protein YiaA [Ulvibacter antarcticus]